MDIKTGKYLEILKIELEDLVYDLEFGEQVLMKRLKEHEITEYVFLENIGLLKKEILGIERVQKVIEKARAENKTISELGEVLEEYFAHEIRAAGLPNVVTLLVKRKLEKVNRYMSIDE